MTNRPIRRRLVSGALAATGAMLATTIMASAAGAASTSLASQSTDGAIANGESREPALSKTGRFITFQSSATNLATPDTNGVDDCFVRDMSSGSTERVSVDVGGGQANSNCAGPSISEDGRFVAFESSATDLVNDDTNGSIDIFVFDRDSDTTRRVSVSSDGTQGDADSRDPYISGNGRYVVFESKASNLVGNDTNGKWDIFRHDLDTGRTIRVSVRSNGRQANGSSKDASTSRDGKVIAFRSFAKNLVKGDTNRKADIFVHDTRTGKTSRVSVGPNGRQAKGGHSGNPTVNAGGRFIAFDSVARNLVRGDSNRVSDVFLRDRKTNRTIRVSVRSSGAQANGGSGDPTINGSGRYIVFESGASNLVSGDTNRADDVFRYDRKAKRVKRVNLWTSGKQAWKLDSSDPVVSADGRFVVFESGPKLVRKDKNGVVDIYRRGAY